VSDDPPVFSHGDAGTPESTWLTAPQWDAARSVDVPALARAHPRVVVLSAHPDDETLAVGGLLAALHRAGAPSEVVVATSGEASHPGSSAWTPQALATVRRAEVERAVATLAPGAAVHHLGLPDGGLTQRRPELVARLRERITAGTLVLAPHPRDGHPDHDVLGQAARQVSRDAGAAVVHYPVWLWHWGLPTGFPWSSAKAVEPGLDALALKREALALFPSQTDPLGPGAEHAAVVTEPVLRRAHRPFETVIDPDDVVPVLPVRSRDEVAGPFDAMFDGGPDPWAVRHSPYERRKRALTVASLRRHHYPRVLEIGCSTGVLTRELAAVAGAVTAIDASARALEVACRADAPGVTWVHGHVPDALPPGPFDLAVLSEVGYFLTPLALVRTIASVRRTLAPGGEVLLVHWQKATQGIPLDGGVVHRLAGSVLEDLGHRAHYRDDDVAIDLWGGRGSLAAEEGRG
jgi:LmbE family N-acetylglucosaminyl deacetylase/SAM-dependent methyltransferase